MSTDLSRGCGQKKRAARLSFFITSLLLLLHIRCSSAAFIRPSRNSGAARPISFSARSQVLAPARFATAVLGGDVEGLAARAGYDVAAGEIGRDAALYRAVLGLEGAGHADEGLAAPALHRAGEEVDLAAGAAYLAGAGALGAHLAVEVYADDSEIARLSSWAMTSGLFT